MTGTRADVTERNFKHGHAARGKESREYRSWRGMRERCGNPSHNRFKYYGALGVKVCARWRNSFEAFLADMGSRPLGMTLDRWPNTRGNYKPTNCRWSTPSEQRKNQREQDDNARCLSGWKTRRVNGWTPNRDSNGRFV